MDRPWPKGIGAITLFVEDLEAAKQFYRRIFGLPAAFEDDSSTVFKFGNTLVNLLKTTAAGELIEPAKAAGKGLSRTRRASRTAPGRRGRRRSRP